MESCNWSKGDQARLPGNVILLIQTFYHWLLHRIMINKQDFLQVDGREVHEFCEELLEKHHEAGTWTFTSTSYHSASRNVVVHSILLAGKCYTHTNLFPTTMMTK